MEYCLERRNTYSHSSLHQLSTLTDRNARHRPQRGPKFIARVSDFPFFSECSFFCEIGEIASCRCRRSSGNRLVIAGTESSFETLWPFLEHPYQRFLLPVIELTA